MNQSHVLEFQPFPDWKNPGDPAGSQTSTVVGSRGFHAEGLRIRFQAEGEG